jgi:ribonuclease P protein component
MHAGQKGEKNYLFLTTGNLNNIWSVFSKAEMEKYLQTNQFKKFERLNRKSSIAFLFEKGKSYTTGQLKICWILSGQKNDFPLSVLFSVSKKNFPDSYQRNKIKRLLRESYRNNKRETLIWLTEKGLNAHAAFIFSGRKLPHYSTIEKQMVDALKKLNNEIVAETA